MVYCQRMWEINMREFGVLRSPKDFKKPTLEQNKV